MFRGLRRREEELETFGDPAVLARGSTLGDAWVARRRAWIQLAAVALGLIALARPQLGERQAELARSGRDLLLVLDLSRSMTVTDVAPNRLAAAKAAAWETVSVSPGDRVGLIVFGGSAFLQLPLTSDHAALKLFLDAASPDDLADPATDLGNALATAGKVFEHEGDRGHRAVLLVSDGESGEGDLEAATKSLRAEGIPVFALGVGTTGGGPVPADSSEAPEKFHRDHIGRIAISKLEESDLRAVAKLTGGAYARADRAADRTNLRATLAKVRSRMLSAQKSAERADRFQWPLALAVAALLGDLALAWVAGRRRRGAMGAGRRLERLMRRVQGSGSNEERCCRGRPDRIEELGLARRSVAPLVDQSDDCVAVDAAPPRERGLLAGLTRRAEGRAALRRRRLRRLGQGARPSPRGGHHACPGLQRGQRVLPHAALRGRGRALSAGRRGAAG